MHIFEALFIFALDEDEGYIVESAAENLESALAGAVFVELVLLQRIELVGNRVVVKEQTPTSHPVLDKALFDIIGESRLRKLSYWINNFAHRQLLSEIGQDLVEQGMLFQSKKRLHLANASGDGQVVTPSVKFSLKNHLREIVLTSGQPELRDQVLLAFLYHANLLRLVFTVGERKAASRRVKEYISTGNENDSLGKTLTKIYMEVNE